MSPKINDKVREQLNKDHLASAFSPIPLAYIDLTLLKDTRMGLLLSQVDNTQKQYILSKLPIYFTQPDRSFLYAFPKLGLDEDTLQKQYHDPEYNLVSFLHSPDTDLYPLLKAEMMAIREQNVRSGEPVTCTLEVNVWPLQLIPVMQLYHDKLIEFLRETGCHVRLISKDPTSLDSVFWNKHRYIFIDDFTSVNQESHGLRKALLEDKSMYAHKVYTVKQSEKDTWKHWISQGMNPEDPDTISKFYIPSAAVMQACCIFKFLQLSFNHKK